MVCPVCGYDEFEVIKSKGKKNRDLLVKCDECGHVYHETAPEEAHEVKVRVIISEFETSWKTNVTLYSDEYLEVGTILYIDDKDVEVTSIETKEEKRLYECPVIDIKTIWAKSLDTLARIGLSIDNHGTVLSHKLEVERDFIFTIGDVCEVNGLKFRVYAFKTLERNMRKGYAYAKVIKRVYGRLLPRNDKSRVNYDLSEYVVKTTIKEKDYN
ncbi:HVO_0476 family zinc finger protein [Candidatus Methanosphaera massiliense]|jgi:uncharacterized Zn finger protein|uniref:HVO_0476 family zinc finger protein n=1 Tax=Methanosphaera TaxID=2316 RepID=UPI000DC5E2B3|nr:HVO_0476 family zinc finger protein [Candidatus Methanosphaera massiliense]MDD6285117.1 HVO_0476 family zinc finger protein [Methanobacteriaceae archaeon]MDE4078330.1 HVO_0476 family zinc finger protein [Candidatus Methanosphaera massiliense]MDY2744324.1 HVO_0476 family zinc finger protein [Methanosphaera sp.]RAP44645.1 MAG: hypothetical protein BZ134_03010 [Methanosphaera sp. SHI1033]